MRKVFPNDINLPLSSIVDSNLQALYVCHQDRDCMLTRVFDGLDLASMSSAAVQIG
jgi:hypothetical protein